MAEDNGKRRGIPLHTKILAGLVFGAVAGVVSNRLWGGTAELAWVINNIATPVGQVFLRMLFMIVVPLVFTSLALGVAGLGDLSRIGRIGGKALLMFLFTTTIAVVIGLTLANTVRPGEALDPAVRNGLLEEFADEAAQTVGASEETGFGINTIVQIVPRNPVESASRGDMLGLIFFTLVFGIALTKLPRDLSAPVIRGLEGVGKAVEIMIGFAMRIAPIGVVGLIFAVTARFGFEIVRSLALYVVMVLVGLLFHQFAVLPTLAKLLAGVSPGVFLKKCRAVMVTAFSTSSSSATLPTTMRTAEYEFGVPKEVSGFVLPLGATMNMNGTALFEGMTVLFLAQVFGVDLSLGLQIVVVLMSVITAIGAAGVPSGSIPLLVMVLTMVGVPGQGIALVLGVDRILDMTRTVPNVCGDILTSLVVTKSERLPFEPPAPVGAELDLG